MNQTVTVNISGIVFHIEVDAYEELKNYLNKIRSYFNNSEECEEIMTDIEARIAELFNQKISSTNQVIREKDVEEVIAIMGKPEQYITDDEEETEAPKTGNTGYTNKRIFRNPDDRIVGGVASGLAAYFGMDALWIRLFFVIAFFIGFGFLLYIILWIVMPEAKTASDKLQMRGEPINIQNIGKTFQDEANRINEQLKNADTGKFARKAESAFESFFSFFLQLLKGFFRVMGKIIGVVFLIVGVFWLVALLGMLIGSETIFSITSDGIFSIESTEFFNLIFVSEDQFLLALTGAVLTIGIPIVAIIYAGIKLLFKIRSHYSVGIGLFVLWVVGIAISGMVGIKMGTEFTNHESVTVSETIGNNATDYFISAETAINPGKGILEDRYSLISLDNDSIYMNDIQMDIVKSENDSMELEVIKYSNGHSRKDALTNAKSISYIYSIHGDSLFFNNYIATLKEHKIRGQQVKIKLYLPVGKSIYLDKSLKRIIHDVDNVTDTWDHDMLEKKWVMLEKGLTCLDCAEIHGITTVQLDSLRTHEPEIE